MIQKYIYLLLFITISSAAFYFFLRTSPTPFDPISFEQQFNKATQLLIAGDNDQALELYLQLLAHNDTYPTLHFNCGRAWANKKNYDKAIACFTKALAFNTSLNHLIHMQLGLAYYALNNLEQASVHCAHAVAIQPDYSDALYYLGRINHDQQKYSAAWEYYEKAARINPEFIKAMIALATVWRDTKQVSQAWDACLKIIALQPKQVNALVMLGDISVMQGNHDRARAYYHQACDSCDACHEAHNNVGTLYASHYGDYQKSYYYLQKALAIDPQHAATHAGLSAWYLVHGNFEQGWQEYEWRLHPFFGKSEVYTKPRWNGAQPGQHTTLLVHAEQGFGDTFQFVRYVACVKAMGFQVILQVQPPLKKVLSCAFDTVIAFGEPLPPYDYHVELMSLPYFVKTNHDSIPCAVPYIHPDQTLVEQWQQTLAQYHGYKVGICWHVDPCHDADVFRGDNGNISVAGCKRSIPLQLFIALSSIPGVTLLSLQKHSGLAQLTGDTKKRVVDFGDALDTRHGSFMDTAALMKSLDLVITADTAIAHLAGALGVPVWVLLPFPADWRWLLDRNDTPWYPSMRLFRRRKEDKDWQPVMRSVYRELKKNLT